MDKSMQEELRQMRVEDDKATGSTLMVVATITIICAFIVIYIIAGLNGKSY